MDKNLLRASLRKARQSIVLERQNCVFELEHRVEAALQSKGVIAGYVTNGAEPDILPWLMKLAATGSRCALPQIETRESSMTFKSWAPGNALVKAPFGFLQPAADQEAALPEIILTPLLGFDRLGNRLGQGAGHYDRYFANHPSAIRIGVAWSIQEVKTLPVEPWDVRLDAILTENETILPPHTRIDWL